MEGEKTWERNCPGESRRVLQSWTMYRWEGRKHGRGIVQVRVGGSCSPGQCTDGRRENMGEELSR